MTEHVREPVFTLLKDCQQFTAIAKQRIQKEQDRLVADCLNWVEQELRQTAQKGLSSWLYQCGDRSKYQITELAKVGEILHTQGFIVKHPSRTSITLEW